MIDSLQKNVNKNMIVFLKDNILQKNFMTIIKILNKKKIKKLYIKNKNNYFQNYVIIIINIQQKELLKKLDNKIKFMKFIMELFKNFQILIVIFINKIFLLIYLNSVQN